MGPGEKLGEQMFSEEEAKDVRRTGKLLVCHGKRGAAGLDEELLEKLRQAAIRCRRAELIGLLRQLLPDYRPAGDCL